MFSGLPRKTLSFLSKVSDHLILFGQKFGNLFQAEAVFLKALQKIIEIELQWGSTLVFRSLENVWFANGSDIRHPLITGHLAIWIPDKGVGFMGYLGIFDLVFEQLLDNWTPVSIISKSKVSRSDSNLAY